MLLPRILTAIIGVPLIIAAIHIGGLVYAAFIGIIIALSLYEYGLILWVGKKPVNRIGLFIFGLLMAAVAVTGRGLPVLGSVDNLAPLAINLTVLSLVLWELLTPSRSFERLAYTMLGVFLIPWTLAHLINIREIRPHGEYLTLMIFITVWTCDTAAYFGGRAFGRNKLMPDVSPKKTWEGAVAGFVGAVVISVFLRNLLVPSEMSQLQAVVLGVCAGTVGQLSDLAESMIKRSTGVKDSSGLLPGHGGILDRFDSYLLLAPVYYYGVILLK